MYQILKNVLAELTIKQRIDLLTKLYENCGCCRFSFAI